ncbi:TetR/AcrR family transcriptional regulator [Streptomyces kanamyceticus]|uniref:TetR family transcriptional regulator n=1 Tax=Streptomyces kanamyceticus TaxID=1967 RepID=A0A5J6G9N3_STRKN|nr:TetR/AcrR family transcriptional regulator C-terminal domain-containing protein [Streptomyces kanamyceticus]QEU92219.1 TetR family transcriptional regulator [Streptomyces kanamyceticus]
MATEKKKSQPDPSLWERLERPAATQRTALTLRKIAAVAVRIADAEGFPAVTMRRLATELGVAPMAAYRHVADKNELAVLMVEQVTGELVVPDGVSGWRDVLHAFAGQARQLMLNHPWLAHMPTPLYALTPSRMAVAERQLASLDGLGLDADQMMVAFRTVNAYVQGSTQAEVVLRRYRDEHGWHTGEESRTALAPQMNYLMATGRYPTYHRYAHSADRKDDETWMFESGLDCVLDGIAARLGI